MGPFLSISGALGFTGRAKTLAAWFAALLAILALLALCWWMASRYLSNRDDRVVGADRDKATVETQGRVIKADRAAGEAKAAKDAATQAEIAELQRKADEARRNNASALDAVSRGLRSEAPR